MIDLHCHILPALDDGAGTIEEALAMAAAAVADGIRTIAATPHVFREALGSASFPAIEKKRRELDEAIGAAGIPVNIVSGAEVHISHNLIEEIRSHRKSLVLNGGSYLFLEFPQDHVFSGIKDLVFDLMSEGVIPIIAHPERNSAFRHSPRLLYELVEMGCLAQANGGSLLGRHGERVEACAFGFLEGGLLHFIASDGHNSETRPPRLREAVARAAAAVGEKAAEALVRDNPEAVLADKDIVYRPAPADPDAGRGKMKIRIPRFFGKKL